MSRNGWRLLYAVVWLCALALAVTCRQSEKLDGWAVSILIGLAIGPALLALWCAFRWTLWGDELKATTDTAVLVFIAMMVAPAITYNLIPPVIAAICFGAIGCAIWSEWLWSKPIPSAEAKEPPDQWAGGPLYSTEMDKE